MMIFPCKTGFPWTAKNDTFGWLARPRSPRHRWYIGSRARETRNKTHHARSGGATGGPWCVLLRVSRAHVAMCYRCRGLRGRATDRKSVILVVPGRGHVPHFRNFWGTNAGTVRAVPMRATFGQKIFFDRMAVSSRRSSTEGYQNEFFSDVCSLSRAQSAHVRSPPGDSRSTKSTSRRQV